MDAMLQLFSTSHEMTVISPLSAAADLTQRWSLIAQCCSRYDREWYPK